MKSCALINLFYFEREIVNIIEGIMTRRLEGKKNIETYGKYKDATSFFRG